MATRIETRTATTHVRHIASPTGTARENGPHLGDLREFVDACDGLSNDEVVFIQPGNLDSGGRRNVEFRLTVTSKIQ